MSNWELKLLKGLTSLRLVSIKNRLLVFAALAALIPSLSTAWISYLQNSRALNEKINEELSASGTQTAREIDLWLKERLYEVRVFAASYEVSENLDRVRRGAERAAATRRLRDYLTSVNERFSDVQELVVVDPQRRSVASSGTDGGRVVLPDTWIENLRTRDAITGRAYWDSTVSRELMTVAVGITALDGRFVGALAAKINLGSVADTLTRFAPGQSGEVYLITRQGHPIISSRESPQALLRDSLPLEAMRALRQASGAATHYTNYRGTSTVGAMVPIPILNWAVVAEIPRSEAFAQIDELRNDTLLTVVGLLAVIGLLGYVFGLTIVRPLNRLSAGATQVAAGDLSVNLPVLGTGEVALVTEVFNDMVSRLRVSREELEKLSRTDALTGLPNRRNLMETLDREVRRAARTQHSFSLLMIDVDHFKHYNDTYGHLAGDEVLGRLAKVLQQCIRTSDYAARYGGEEFTVLLLDTSLTRGIDVAERIRGRMSAERFRDGRSITVSIGGAEFPTHGDSPDAAMAAADAALYQAKQHGRNQVRVAQGSGAGGQPVAAVEQAVPPTNPGRGRVGPARRGAGGKRTPKKSKKPRR